MITAEQKLELIINYMRSHDDEFAKFMDNIENLNCHCNNTITSDIHAIIRDVVIKFEVRPGLEGFDNIVTALEMIDSDPTYLKGLRNRLYTEIAERKGTTIRAVEHSIRYAATSTGMTNKDFLATLAMKVEDAKKKKGLI